MSSREVLARTLLENRFLSASEFRANLFAPPAEMPEGKPYGKYLVLRKIGEGGLSKVFLALDPLLQRHVAIKVLKRPDPEDLVRFRREAQLSAGLHHPNIVPLYESGRVGKETYLAMGYIDGSPPPVMEPDAAARVVLKVAQALAVAHDRSLVHRDVKPQNIILDSTGEPYLTDFGLAKRLDEEGFKFLSQTGTVMGTPCYMSPEQARGETHTLSPATDVYSLGATLYYLSTGRVPFDGTTALEIIRKVVETRPVDARVVNPRVSKPLNAIIRKAMEPRISERYPDAGAMALDLERCLDRQPVLAARLKIPLPVAASAGIALLLLLGVVLSPDPTPLETPAAIVSRERPEPAKPPPAPPAAEPETPPKEPLPVEEPAPPPPAPKPVPPEPRVGMPIDAALKAEVRRRVLDQPLGYQDLFLSEPERKRAWKLLSGERGAREDLDFLRSRLAAEVGGLIEAERQFLVAAAAERAARARQVDAPDLLRFKDGRTLAGRVLQESGAEIHFEYRGQTAGIPRTRVASVTRNGSRESRFVERLNAVEGKEDVAEWIRLGEWCRERKLASQREYVLYRILRLDPANASVRRDLGLPERGPLRRARAAAAVASGPDRPVEFEGKTYTLAGLQAELGRRGFVVLRGKWHRLKDWSPPPAVAAPALATYAWHELKEKRAFDVARNELVTVRRPVEKLRYLAPAPPRTEAEVRFEVEAPGPIYGGTVRADSEVAGKRGSIAFSLEIEGREMARLWELTGGEDRKAHELPPAVRSLERFTLVARIAGTPVSDPAGRSNFTARLLKRKAGEPLPLEIRLRLAVPAASLDSIPVPK